jgi:pimeloyl-ACP methyl ester carboxylesterase
MPASDSKVNVYFISGLGADGRVFNNLVLPPHCQKLHLDWIPPLKDESLPDYARRLATRIDRTKEFYLAGLSFGGMLAVEIARQLPPKKLILISSVPAPAHLPFYYQFAYHLRLHKIVPISLLKQGSLIKRLMTKETKGDKAMLRQMIRQLDPVFTRWAMHCILTWKCETPPFGYIHIHGTSDRILPMRYTKPTHRIHGAGHLMVMERAEEINTILRMELS